MTRFISSRRSTLLSAGAVFPFMVWVLLAPTGAQAGCSHLVISRTNPVWLPSLVDLSGGEAGRSEPLPVTPPPRPCSGAWCSEQPATPAVPPGSIDGRLHFWAWCASIPERVPIDPFFLTLEISALHAVHRRTVLFHPPRLVPSA
jgi:hypothetical protein